MSRWTAMAALLVVGASLLIAPGCQSGGARVAQAPPAEALPSYAEIRERYNARTDRLSRVWARAVVSIRFTDDKGKRRWEQGEGHFQLIQPSRLALSVGKLGEVFFWIGCDDDRYWIIDAKEEDVAWVGRHELVTPEKVASLGLPAPPRSLIRLSGVVSLPPPSADITYGWGRDGSILLEYVEGRAIWRYTLDPRDMRPLRIEVLRAADRVIEASATLEEYQQVQLAGVPGYFPLMASRITASQAGSDAEIRISLAGMSDGGGNRLSANVFNFEHLMSALGVGETVSLDEPVAAH